MLKILLLCFGIGVTASAKGKLKPCGKDTPAGSLCLGCYDLIRPTQFTVGRIEIARGAEKLKAKDAPPKTVTGVIGPDGEFYAVDGHHKASSALLAGIETGEFYVLRNYSHLTLDEFWRKMFARGWVYPYELGLGPLDPEQLPRTLAEMTDDPYRSLASAVRRMKGFSKCNRNFSEFEWAELFRRHLQIEDSSQGFQHAVQQAYELARSRAACELPGYRKWKKGCDKALAVIIP
jgi:hypothetical protein